MPLKRNLALTGLVAILAFLSLYPLAMLFYGSIHSTPPFATVPLTLSGST